MILPSLMILCCPRKARGVTSLGERRICPRAVGACETSADQVGENAASRPSPSMSKFIDDHVATLTIM
jgi:hypothetical protein